MNRLNRRHFLRSAGSMLALPFLESNAIAAPTAAAAPKRLVCLGVALSMYPKAWHPKETGKNYALPRLLEPLAELRDDFTVISGTDHPGVTGGHKGTPAFLSGIYQPERVGQSIVIRNQVTLDQLAAQHLGQATRYESLQLGAAPGSPDGALSWNAKGVPLLSEGDPQKVFNRLFVNPPNLKSAKQAMRFECSILDLVMEDAADFRRQLGHEDQGRVDDYLSSVRDVEKRVGRQQQWLNTAKPDVPALGDSPVTYHDNLDLMLELAVLALQTDSTRVISVNLPGSGLPIVSGNQRNINYHGESHHGKDPDVIADLIEIELLHTRSLARFITRLKEANLLDSTQVLFGSGLGNASSHSNRNLPVLLAGGGLRHGRHLGFDPGTPLCNVYVTMLQRLGIDIDAFAGSTGNVNNEIA